MERALRARFGVGTDRRAVLYHYSVAEVYDLGLSVAATVGRVLLPACRAGDPTPPTLVKG